ncbi:hypothetical protein [Brevibacillus choshinensis]|uniref:hypothetical protein n=1 Tax=Brevibacillus choshinensis TaxID=54911 RepID=UPI002E1E9CE8|nr:hypothetical protein [Brevibacillus choshinensis]
MNKQQRIAILDGLKRAAMSGELNGDEGKYYEEYTGCMCALGYLLKESGFKTIELERQDSINVFGVPDEWREEWVRFGLPLNDARDMQEANDSHNWEKVVEMAEEAKSKVPGDDLT